MTGGLAVGLSLALAASFAAQAAVERAPARLDVLAAASLAEPFAEIGALYEKRRPGTRVRFNFAGTQVLAGQIEQGAPGDVFASADPRWMDRVRALGKVAGEPAAFAANRLVVLVPRSDPARIRRLHDLARPGVKIVMGDESVPVGAYARRSIEQLGRTRGFGADWSRRVLANVVSFEENVRSVVGKVQLGEADAGFAYRSDAGRRGASRCRILEIPPAANVRALYPIAVLREARDPAAARELVALVRSAEGRAILARHGFEAPPEH